MSTAAAAALPLTEQARVEIVNGSCLAAFRRAISAEAMSDALASAPVSSGCAGS